MNRIELIQEIFKKNNFKNYLEIGTETGHSLMPIKAKNKIAIDPQFKIVLAKKIKWVLLDPNNLKNRYFQETSDDFFLKRKEFLGKFGQLDVVLVDGLHTFRAALNDVINSLKYLNPQGVIIMHDCLPPHEAASIPVLPATFEEQQKINGWTGTWCGDVWKSIIYLRRNCSDILDVCVLNTDYGLGIIRMKNNKKLELKIDENSYNEIDKLTYTDLTKNLKEFINIKDSEYSKVIINEISALSN